MVDTRVVLVIVIAPFLHRDQIVLARQTGSGQRQLAKQSHGCGVQMKRGIVGNVIGWNGLMRDGIENRGCTREIPAALRHGWDAEQVGKRLPGSLTIVIEEEKCAAL